MIGVYRPASNVSAIYLIHPAPLQAEEALGPISIPRGSRGVDYLFDILKNFYSCNLLHPHQKHRREMPMPEIRMCHNRRLLFQHISIIELYLEIEIYRETCLNQTLNKPESCINRTLKKVSM